MTARTPDHAAKRAAISTSSAAVSSRGVAKPESNGIAEAPTGVHAPL